MEFIELHKLGVIYENKLSKIEASDIRDEFEELELKFKLSLIFEQIKKRNFKDVDEWTPELKDKFKHLLKQSE